MNDLKRTIEISGHSNIALVKYWGKKGKQLPINPSLSFSLKNAKTYLTVDIEKSSKPSFSYKFEGVDQINFSKKSNIAWNVFCELYPILNQFKIEIDSTNTFPHSTGIASSASSQMALAILATELITELKYEQFNLSELNICSSLARLASGSACRSINPGINLWGKTDLVSGSSDEYAIQISDVNPIFKDYQDTILVISSNPKKISSSAGHSLMDDHPYKNVRISDANQNLKTILSAMKMGDIEKFSQIVESEAMSLHAMMMTSSPSVILMEPKTLEVLNLIQLFRKESNLPITFSLDAGPNVHLLYPSSIKAKIDPFIKHELSSLCISEKGILQDEVW